MEVIDGILMNTKFEDLLDGVLELPEGITKIAPLALNNICHHVKKIILPKSMRKVGIYEFASCTVLTELEIKEGLEEILDAVGFTNKSIETIKLPNTLKKINSFAFHNCHIKSIEIPGGVEKIERFAFVDCHYLERVVINEGVKIIKEEAFRECFNLKEVILPNSLRSIGTSAFLECESLENIELPENLEELGSSVFKECKELKEINLPENIEVIKKSTFSFCENLESIFIGSKIKTIEEGAFEETNLKKITTPWGESRSDSEFGDATLVYLFLFSNHLLKEKYEDIDAFLSNFDIYRLIGDYSMIYRENTIEKFKNLFSKLRKEYDIDSTLFSFLKEETTRNLTYQTWNQIKNVFNYKDSFELSQAFSEIIEVFGLFHKDQKTNQRIRMFKNSLEKQDYKLSYREYKSLLNDYSAYGLFLSRCAQKKSTDWITEIEKSFDRKEVGILKLKDEIEIPDEFRIYIKETITEEERKKIKKLSGTYGKRLNDFIRENYIVEQIEKYHLNEYGKNNQYIRDLLFKQQYLGYFNSMTLHNIFSGCKEEYDENFYNFFIDNLPFILKSESIQTSISKIQKDFQSIEYFYQQQAGTNKITLKQALDYINDITFFYKPGNYEFMLTAKTAGVNDQAAFNYYQEIYEKNKERRLYSLIRRNNIYEIDGFTIQVELLRKDDPLNMLVGETNYTNCCQRYHGVGHNCMAHASCSEDGGIFVMRLLKDGEWILLTESWDWQNSNLYCHDNIEGTEYLKEGSEELKKAVAKALKLDAEFIIEKSKKEVENYIKTRRKILEKSPLENKQEEIEKLDWLSKNEIIKVVTAGTGYDDLGLMNYFDTKIRVNEEFFIGNKKYTLSNFQPINYNQSKSYFDDNYSAYSDAKETQYIITGSIENLVLSKNELIPIYRDERRVQIVNKEKIGSKEIKKISEIEQIDSEKIRTYQGMNKDDTKDSTVYLGEDWYLIYENRENGNIYISNLVRIDPILQDERGIQQKEILSTLSALINSSNKIEADLKEDTTYILYLMNKHLGYIEQIGEDIIYSIDRKNESRVVTEEEQEKLLRDIDKLRQEKNSKIFHKVLFQKK